MKIGIIGNGYVGGAMALLSEFSEIESYIYDIEPARCVPIGLELEELKSCDLIFVCVPTPMKEDGSCCINAVKNVVEDLQNLDIPLDKITVRSTVPVGTCADLGVNFMPEFLTEANWQEDFRKNKDWIIGLDSEYDFESPELWEKRSPFSKLAGIAHRSILYTKTKEAECVKLIRNSFLAMKVSFFNEINDYCKDKGLDFDVVREGATQDKRIGPSHSKVPGPDGKKGFGGTCFPKDVHSLFHQMYGVNYENYEENPPSLLWVALTRNENLDRKEKDWENNKGRAVV